MPVIVGQISFFPVWQGFVFLFHKELRPSDVSSLGRMILPKASGLFTITCHVLQITASSKMFSYKKTLNSNPQQIGVAERSRTTLAVLAH